VRHDTLPKKRAQQPHRLEETIVLHPIPKPRGDPKVNVRDSAAKPRRRTAFDEPDRSRDASFSQSRRPIGIRLLRQHHVASLGRLVGNEITASCSGPVVRFSDGRAS
jgi:hypothetical protein